MKEILFKGFTKQTSKEHLQEIFANYGTIKKLELNTDEKTGYSYGTGIVEFETHEQAVKLVDVLDESQVDGKLVSLRLKQSVRERPPAKKRSPPPPRDRYAHRPYSPPHHRRQYNNPPAGRRDDRNYDRYNGPPPRRDDRNYGRDYDRSYRGRSPSPQRRRRYSSSRSPSPDRKRYRARTPPLQQREEPKKQPNQPEQQQQPNKN